MNPRPLHSTTVARWSGVAGWRGLLITGPSGAGKSDLALRLIGRGWRLVADDYAHVFASGGHLYAAAPGTIAGQMEARGLGVVGAASLGLARLALWLELSDGAIERMPERGERRVDGVALPLLRLNGFEPSAVEKVTVAIDAL